MPDILPKHDILFRHAKRHNFEYEAAKKYMNVEVIRTKCYSNLVVGRYISDDYDELYDDIKNNYGSLINSPEQHNFLKNFNYYNLIREYTPKTWNIGEFNLSVYEGPFVVRGTYGSKNRYWNKSMFAKDKATARMVGLELYKHNDLGGKILYRKYVPLKSFSAGYNGIYYANEWRFFFLRRDIVASGYYWDEAPKTIQERAYMNQDGIKFAAMIARIICDHCNFFTVDIAETYDGDWIVIDIDDGQEKALRCIEPAIFYRNLNVELKRFV